MPCSPGMRNCARSCAHRRMVEEFRITRHAQELAREAVTKGWATEEREERERSGPLINFKDWLLGLANHQIEELPDTTPAAIPAAA